MGIEGKWVFGRVMPRDLLEGISRYLKRAAPEREKEMVDQIRSRAEELSDADDDMAVDRPAKGLLTMASVVLAAFEVYFDIAFSPPDPDTFEMRVDRCFFRDFFDRHDARPVTTALCGWDANGMQALDPATSGLRSERTTLLSLGDDAYRFRVLRTDNPLADHDDALDRQ
jgi:hypothetical protein